MSHTAGDAPISAVVDRIRQHLLNVQLQYAPPAVPVAPGPVPFDDAPDLLQQRPPPGPGAGAAWPEAHGAPRPAATGTTGTTADDPDGHWAAVARFDEQQRRQDLLKARLAAASAGAAAAGAAPAPTVPEARTPSPQSTHLQAQQQWQQRQQAAGLWPPTPGLFSRSSGTTFDTHATSLSPGAPSSPGLAGDPWSRWPAADPPRRAAAAAAADARSHWPPGSGPTAGATAAPAAGDPWSQWPLAGPATPAPGPMPPAEAMLLQGIHLDPRPGFSTRMEDYHIGPQLGAGTFATVYRATMRTGQVVALKAINKHHMIENFGLKVAIRRVQGEVLIHSSLRASPYIVQLLAAFETRHEVILVMELCQGGTLLEYFRTRTRILRDAGSSQAGGLPEREVRGIFSQIAKGLFQLHASSTMHRDLKLANILLADPVDPAQPSPAPRVKIADFGLAARLGSDPLGSTHSPVRGVPVPGDPRWAWDPLGTPSGRLAAPASVYALSPGGVTEQRTVCGTPNYLSPEIVDQRPYSLPADVWALGCILYHLCVGHAPFERPRGGLGASAGTGSGGGHGTAGRPAGDMVGTFRRISDGNYARLDPTRFSLEACDLLDSMLDMVPTRRPSAGEVCSHPFVQRSLEPATDDYVPPAPELLNTMAPSHYAPAYAPAYASPPSQQQPQPQPQPQQQQPAYAYPALEAWPATGARPSPSPPDPLPDEEDPLNIDLTGLPLGRRYFTASVPRRGLPMGGGPAGPGGGTGGNPGPGNTNSNGYVDIVAHASSVTGSVAWLFVPGDNFVVCFEPPPRAVAPLLPSAPGATDGISPKQLRELTLVHFVLRPEAAASTAPATRGTGLEDGRRAIYTLPAVPKRLMRRLAVLARVLRVLRRAQAAEAAAGAGAGAATAPGPPGSGAADPMLCFVPGVGWLVADGSPPTRGPHGLLSQTLRLLEVSGQRLAAHASVPEESLVLRDSGLQVDPSAVRVFLRSDSTQWTPACGQVHAAVARLISEGRLLPRRLPAPGPHGRGPGR
ncbi:PLK/SAK protein kinase [Fonticula alba]|uniref:PLK/SAK protein kinase n=1 Tax=Fonticula alba TaxID=691883 RepID=A0A058ZBW8_FONAL|nr:PLK/SAK protein kinase [Fonticula alba]KCV70922.1 PLK/SAK protein kinase [Fonticula alba]|eukprot:XP_009494045.1 PLK/SAK protein kinase [Fonticula alba]